MTAFALALILGAAAIHASWNFLLKRSGGGTIFVWLFAALSAVLYAPLAAAIIWWTNAQFGWVHYALMAASAAIHTAYFMLLDRGYRSGDMSVVYPLARGTGPLITMLCAVLLLQERPGALAVAGAVMIGCAAFLLTGDPRKLRQSRNYHAIGFALLTGCMIAAYTLVDKVEKIAGVQLRRNYKLDAPRGVAGRNSDNTFIKKVLEWEPNTTLDVGLRATYAWINEQYCSRKEGKPVVV